MTEPISPDLVNAIVRNPDDPRYPSQITVFCDHCGTEHTGEYMVSAEMTSTERLAVARQHLVANAGWEHTADGDDFCPVHAGSPTEEQSAVASLTEEQLAAIEARANAATPGPWCTDSWEIYQGTEYEPGISMWIGETCRGTTSPEQDASDAAFVAAARSDVPALLAEIRRLRAELASSRAAALTEAADEAQGAVGLFEGSDEGAAAAGALEGMAIRFRRMATAEGAQR